MKRPIVVTGAKGQLGTTFQQLRSLCHAPLILLSRAQCDIQDAHAIHTLIEQHQPLAVVNAAAYTAVDRAETEREAALAGNVAGVKQLAMACQAHEIPLIHFSTDYVFPGTQTTPYREDDMIDPVNYYGQSKYLGEEAIRAHCERHIILRVSAVFSEHGNNFVKTILRLARERTTMRVVADQITCPTATEDIVLATFAMLRQLSHWGTFHFCGAAPTSWHAFAENVIALARQYESLAVQSIEAIATTDYPTPAQRPAYSVLDCQRLQQAYGISQPDWFSRLAISVRRLCTLPASVS